MDFKLDSNTFKRILPFEYQQRFKAQGIRPDGRSSSQSRPTLVNLNPIGNANGSALVKCGETVVICGIRAEVSPPDPLDPTNGFFIVNLDLPALCSSKFRPGPPGEFTQSLTHKLHTVFKEAHVLDTTQFCIVPGKVVWAVYADIVCLNYDGNVLDAATSALFSALSVASLPTIELDDVSYKSIEPKIPIVLNRVLRCSSYGVFEDELYSDCSADEEELVHATLSFWSDGTYLCGSQVSSTCVKPFQDPSVSLEILNRASSLAMASPIY